MKRRHVDLGKSDENIAEQYDDIIEGLQKDAGQNSWDARLTKKAMDWKLYFRYIADRNTLVIEDFGTTGMNEERWERYQGLWSTTKADEDALGARGQGKFLFHYFSATKHVLTETIDQNGVYRFSYGTSEEWDEDKTLNDFIPGAAPLDHQGSRIWILDVRDDLMEELLDYRRFMRYIAITWWETIRNWNATFVVNFNGVDRTVEVPLVPESEHELRLQSVKVKDLGRIRNLVIRFCKEDVPVDIRGIAVQRGGMTVIRLPVSVEESLKRRICGYCNFDSDLEMELKRVEFPNHFGFRSKKAWNHVRAFIRGRVDEFAEKVRPKKKRKISISESLIQDAVNLVNNIVVDYVPEITGEAIASGGDVDRESEPEAEGGSDVPPRTDDDKKRKIRKRPPPPPVRIARFRGNQRKIEWDENLMVECEVINGTNTETEVTLEVKIRDRNGHLKLKIMDYPLELPAKSRRKAELPVVDFDEGDDEPGQYRATAILRDTSGTELQKRTFSFYVHEDPPKAGRTFLSSIKFLYGNGTELEKRKQLPVTDKGVLWINAEHLDFVHMRTLAEARSKKWRNIETLLYFAKSGIDGAILKLQEYTAGGMDLDENELRRIKIMCDEMYYDAVQQIEG